MDGLSADVTRRATEIAAAARDGGAWLSHGPAPAGAAGDRVAQNFRRFARRAARLQQAAARRTCVAVFGASQAGKSYLVSSLATSGGRPLLTSYGDRTLNFLREMNPQGDKESTGLVTRFTVTPPRAPAFFPVPLRMLSQTDLVKILANAFLEDFKLDELEPMGAAAVAGLFDRLEAIAGPGPNGALSIDDVEELRDYFSVYFRNSLLLQELGSAFWVRAAAVIPRLPAAHWAEAFAPLWNQTPALTQVANLLFGSLERLGFAQIAYCKLDALMPREEGILNADTVFAVAEGGRGLVEVQGDRGPTPIDRSHLAALIAEMTVPLADQPWDFFEHTDLLDFPGARSREVIRSLSFLEEPGRLGRVFLRGKVAYLFQRYNAEQEIAAMLLCVGPSNQDVQTLPEMVSAWIDQTIGPNPKARAVQRNSLFFVLTKFDSEFTEKEGEDVASGQRWTARLQASLLDFFGKAYDWPRNWNGKPFNNVFWLRSTAVRFNAVYDYVEGEPGHAWREVSAARGEPFLQPRQRAYLANDTVRDHFADPTLAWQAALTPNDGGISHLATQLRPVCDPGLKAEQIAGRLSDLAADIDAELRQHYHEGDLAAELERARVRAKELVRDLLKCAKAQRLGALLRAMQVTPDQIMSVYWNLQTEPDDPAPIGTSSSMDDYEEMFGLLEASAPTKTEARDRFERLADLALEDWVRGMQSVAMTDGIETAFRLPREKALILVNEVARASARLALRQRLTQALHKHASYQQRGAAAAQKPTIVVEQIINDFVYHLGFSDVAAEQRLKVPNGSRTIFEPRPRFDGLPPIGPLPTPYESRFNVDWLTAVARTVEDNVRDPGSSTIDVERNAKLGKILQQLGAAA